MIKLFTGSESEVQLLQASLEELGIMGIIKNPFQSGIIAGFGASPYSVEFYVNEEDLEKAQELVAELFKS